MNVLFIAHCHKTHDCVCRACSSSDTNGGVAPARPKCTSTIVNKASTHNHWRYVACRHVCTHFRVAFELEKFCMWGEHILHLDHMHFTLCANTFACKTPFSFCLLGIFMYIAVCTLHLILFHPSTISAPHTLTLSPPLTSLHFSVCWSPSLSPSLHRQKMCD